jgi:protein TonB
MFSNLIESGSHAADLKRKGKFFMGASLFYAVLLAATGVGSIYAYNARLDDANEYEVLALMRFAPVEARPEPARREQPRAASNSREAAVAERTDVSIYTPYHSDRIAPEGVREVGARTAVRIGTVDRDPAAVGGPAGTNYATGPGGPGVRMGPAVDDTTTPPPPAHVTPTPAPVPQRPTGPLHVTSTVLTSKAISKPAPAYPTIAKAAGIQGSVAVQIMIDEQGRVVSAKATSGNGMLMPAAVQAAYQARFSPTLLNGQPVKVTGVITYNFILNR